MFGTMYGTIETFYFSLNLSEIFCAYQCYDTLHDYITLIKLHYMIAITSLPKEVLKPHNYHIITCEKSNTFFVVS